MTKKGFGWKFLAVVFTAALLVSGAGVKAADAARLTHHELTLKDEKDKPLGQAHCVIRDKEGNYLANVISSVDGLIVAMAHPGATLLCVSKELEVHTGEVKAGRKIVTMKQPLMACWACNLVVPPGPGVPQTKAIACCAANYKVCMWESWCVNK
jgi:hypothetical protein